MQTATGVSLAIARVEIKVIVGNSSTETRKMSYLNLTEQSSVEINIKLQQLREQTEKIDEDQKIAEHLQNALEQRFREFSRSRSSCVPHALRMRHQGLHALSFGLFAFASVSLLPCVLFLLAMETSNDSSAEDYYENRLRGIWGQMAIISVSLYLLSLPPTIIVSRSIKHARREFAASLKLNA